MKLETLKRIASLTGGSVNEISIPLLKRLIPELNKRTAGFHALDSNIFFYTGIVELSAGGIHEITHYIEWCYCTQEQVEKRFYETIQLLSDFAEFNFPSR